MGSLWQSSLIILYVFLGALRFATQMVSYEISIGFIIIIVLICVGSCNFSEIVIAQKQYGLALFCFMNLLCFSFLV